MPTQYVRDDLSEAKGKGQISLWVKHIFYYILSFQNKKNIYFWSQSSQRIISLWVISFLYFLKHFALYLRSVIRWRRIKVLVSLTKSHLYLKDKDFCLFIYLRIVRPFILDRQLQRQITVKNLEIIHCSKSIRIRCSMENTNWTFILFITYIFWRLALLFLKW